MTDRDQSDTARLHQLKFAALSLALTKISLAALPALAITTAAVIIFAGVVRHILAAFGFFWLLR